MNLYDSKIVVAIENAVCNQLEASGITADPFRLDGEKIIDVILEQIEGFVLVPKEPTEAMYIAGTDKRQSGGNTADVYKAMIEAQEQSHENG